MTNKEAIRILELERDDWETAHCTPNVRKNAFNEGIKALEDTIPKFHLQCLLCKGDVGVYSTHTMEQVSYTHYSYCEDCLRKGLKLLKADKPEEIRIGDEVISHGVKGIVYMVDDGDVVGVVEDTEAFVMFTWQAVDVAKTGRHFDEVEEMINKYDGEGE